MSDEMIPKSFCRIVEE